MVWKNQPGENNLTRGRHFLILDFFFAPFPEFLEKYSKDYARISQGPFHLKISHENNESIAPLGGPSRSP